jgi:hypothetical protein
MRRAANVGRLREARSPQASVRLSLGFIRFKPVGGPKNLMPLSTAGLWLAEMPRSARVEVVNISHTGRRDQTATHSSPRAGQAFGQREIRTCSPTAVCLYRSRRDHAFDPSLEITPWR